MTKKLIEVDAQAFDDLMYWLDRCAEKGHLENCYDLVDPWAIFDANGWRVVEPTQPADGEPVYQYLWNSDDWIETTKELCERQASLGIQTRTLWTAPPAAAHGDEAVRWVPCSERLPEIAEGEQREFIVSAQRKDKVITMSALYLNAYPLYCEDDDAADDDGNVPHTGWYDARSNGDDANFYTLISDSWYGSIVTHWMPMPKPAAAMRAQGDGKN